MFETRRTTKMTRAVIATPATPASRGNQTLKQDRCQNGESIKKITKAAKVWPGSSDKAANMMAGRKDRKNLQPSNNNIQFGAGSTLKGETK